jgi:hypothetical protein
MSFSISRASRLLLEAFAQFIGVSIIVIERI